MNEFERRIQRLEDIHEIHQLMGRRAYIHSAGLNDREITELWATDRDDITFEPEDWGAWVGRDAIWQSYVSGNPFPADTKGLMIEHALTTPIIEVAGDGQTARGIWISPGHETFPIGEGAPKPHWSWGRYGVDFIKQDGQWKIWRLHVLTTFRTPYDTDWVTNSQQRPEYFPDEGEPMPGIAPPSLPVSFNQPYAIDKAPQLQPSIPEPYETWTESTPKATS